MKTTIYRFLNVWFATATVLSAGSLLYAARYVQTHEYAAKALSGTQAFVINQAFSEAQMVGVLPRSDWA
ncbi:MAG: hypothetical protein M5R36_22155 [Deltaproteobacteria bacterium]|nr:hypothetical protein [Deltaproteobacteria bacterium]